MRKAGFLSVKKWLLRKKHQVELARKRGWKGYWVCLKGTTLLFYPCDSREVSWWWLVMVMVTCEHRLLSSFSSSNELVLPLV